MRLGRPRGFENKIYLKYVSKLRTVLYGLKKALKAWYGKIAEFLT